jgi:hypothetical protein
MTKINAHFLATGAYTCAGAYKDYFRSLPDDISELGRLVCSQVIHRVTLREGNTNANKDLIYGDMNLFPWWRHRCDDDIFLTAAAMTAELFRLDSRGFVADRKVEDKLVVTCRYVSVLMAAILKAKGIPCRCRSGFAPYFVAGKSLDHWINEYWNGERWVCFDADGFFDDEEIGFYQYDIPTEKFDWAAEVWLKIREGKENGDKYVDAGGAKSLESAVCVVFSDFHALMNNEISYKFIPAYVHYKFDKLTEAELAEIDNLAGLMLCFDKNFEELRGLWDSCKKFRVLNSPLVGDWDNGLYV